jgi:hypothetical protein
VRVICYACCRYDVIVNALPIHAIEERFASITRRMAGAKLPPPRVVLATEESCWIGSICTRAEKDAFVRARLRADPNAEHRFMHSQIMGTRSGMLDLLQSGLLSNETDDMKMLFNYIIAHPAQVAFDDHETIFATFARGFVPGVSTSTKHDERSLMCWDGVCAIDQKRRRGISCTTSSGSLALYDNSTGRIARPLMWHVNGPSLAFLKRHPSCAKSAYNAKGWTWSSFSR